MDEVAGTVSEVGATDRNEVGAADRSGRAGSRSPWRFRIVCALAVVLIVVVGAVSWQRWFEGAPELGDRGAATAHVYCELVTVDHDGRTFQSDVGASGASELQASWGDRKIPGRLHLDDRQRQDHKQWTATGRFIADDGTEVAVRGSYGERYSITTSDCS